MLSSVSLKKCDPHKVFEEAKLVLAYSYSATKVILPRSMQQAAQAKLKGDDD